MNRRPILGLTLTFLVAATLVTPAAATSQVGTGTARLTRSLNRMIAMGSIAGFQGATFETS
jgi:hypothetical protein